MGTNDNADLIRPGQMQVYPDGVGSMPLPFLRPSVIAEFMLPNGQRVCCSIDRTGALLVWAPKGQVALDAQAGDFLRVSAKPR